MIYLMKKLKKPERMRFVDTCANWRMTVSCHTSSWILNAQISFPPIFSPNVTATDPNTKLTPLPMVEAFVKTASELQDVHSKKAIESLIDSPTMSTDLKKKNRKINKNQGKQPSNGLSLDELMCRIMALEVEMHQIPELEVEMHRIPELEAEMH
ncbi:hypothetical protein CPB84DRAFT_1751175 [Gymnopilus junonius]|uniref:Uncharacterized protein n=1 Tax=Gymnopilus junonius TaxID=109634 RepID=A0A9P5THF8_GYMJU|nr:hypothetical protein CPB84DRAFT_1751175 [Gymnopilus junonius]